MAEATAPVERGGKAPVAERNVARMGRYCVVEDPAGAVAVLFQAP